LTIPHAIVPRSNGIGDLVVSLIQRFRVLVLLSILAASACAADAGYVSVGQLDLTKVLVPPPIAGSAVEKQELQAVLDAQNARTPEQVARAQADMPVSVFRFADVLGPNFNEARVPKTAAFFQRVTHDANPLWDAAKKHWNRPRPFAVSTDVQPALDRPRSAAYPSGHSSSGYLWAVLLAEMVPEKRAELFARGLEYGHNRIVGGVHWPGDDEAGRISGAVIAALMMQSPEFRVDLESAKAELRAALGYQVPGTAGVTGR
jgi:acid phosphatase (class A)